MDITKDFYDVVSNLKYHDIKIYNYIQTSIDTLFNNGESPEKIEENSLFHGTYQGKPAYEDTDSKAYNEVQDFLNSLEKRDALFFTSSQFRKQANGRLYHTVLDPYILSLPTGQYSVIECGSEPSSMFYEDVHRWNYDTVRCAYGVDSIDFDDLFEYMQREFFPVLRKTLGFSVSSRVEHGITFFLFCRLCFRKAEYNFALDILKKVNPSVIFYSHGCNPCFMYLAEAAEALGIPAVEIAHGAYVPFAYRPAGINDFYILQSKINAEWAIKNGFNRLFCIGKPGFGMTEARRLSSGNGPVIVMFVSSCEYGLLELAAELSNAFDPEKYIVVFRLHSGERYTTEYLNDLTEKNPRLYLVGSADPIEVALDECDIVVGNRTTVLLEALRYRNIKVITCNLDKDPMPPANKDGYIWEKVIESGELVRTSSLEELVREVKSYHRNEFVRNSENYWEYDGDVVFPAFVDLCADKKKKLRLPAGEESTGAVMALYDVDLIPEINEMVASETDLSMEYVGIEASDGEEELIDYIENSPYEYISVVHPGALLEKDKKRDTTARKVALLSNNPYLDLTLAPAGEYEDAVKHLSPDNAVRYRNIVRTGIYPLNNIMDLCDEEDAVRGDLAECVYRKDTFLSICALVGIHNLIKQPATELSETLKRCRNLALKAAYAENECK